GLWCGHAERPRPLGDLADGAPRGAPRRGPSHGGAVSLAHALSPPSGHPYGPGGLPRPPPSDALCGSTSTTCTDRLWRGSSRLYNAGAPTPETSREALASHRRASDADVSGRVPK